jgi:predicted nucleotidyltransferase
MFGMFKTAFVTGSSVYGKAYRTDESDIDLVVLFDLDEWVCLLETIDKCDKAYQIRVDEYVGFESNREPIRFGKLNIIPVFSVYKYKKWKKATERAIMVQPPTRELAIMIFNEEFGGEDR